MRFPPPSAASSGEAVTGTSHRASGVGESSPGLFTVQQAQQMGRKCSSREEMRAALAAFLSLATTSAFRKTACSAGNGSSKEETEFPAVTPQVALVTQPA